MRRDLAEAVRKDFNACLRARVPQFRMVRPRDIDFLGKKEKEIPPGDRLYLWDFTGDLHLYLLLVIATPQMGDAFTVECAWSRNARFPTLAGLMYPYDVPNSATTRDEPKGGDFRFRIGQLWEPRQDHWWWLAQRPSVEELNKWLVSGQLDKGQFAPPEVPIEEAMKNVRPSVEDAVDHIIDYAIPYFEKIIADYNKEKGKRG